VGASHGDTDASCGESGDATPETSPGHHIRDEEIELTTTAATRIGFVGLGIVVTSLPDVGALNVAVAGPDGMLAGLTTGSTKNWNRHC
jgi:hypothetical protein